jgi:hypothetical protein
MSWATPSASPGGSDTQVQFNDAGAFGGDSGLTYNKTTDNLTVLGNLVIGTNGKGIDFSATPGAGTSELLADYEEGTWTPTVTPGSGAFTTISSVGQYVKIGKQVTITLYVSVTTVGTATGTWAIGGFPFVFAYDSAYVTGTAMNQNTGVLATYQVYTPGPNCYITPGTGTTLCANGTKVGATMTYNI